MSTTYKTAESVSPKHPDKLCDQISDRILDAYIAVDANARVAVEAVGGHGQLFVVGEVSSHATVDIEHIVQELAGNVHMFSRIVKQSPEIAAGVDTGGAGDQGIMVGYAVDDTPELLPLETVLARRLNRYLYEIWPFDGKTQITTHRGMVETVVASFQNAHKADLAEATAQWLRHEPLVKSAKGAIRMHVNPCGDWHTGGFDADSGLTGRKLVVDNYGPHIPIGGGAFSGKDPSKVDRSAAYMARRIAVDLLHRHRAHEVYCYLAYAIGVAEPVEATAMIDGRIHTIKNYDLTPEGIIQYLDLRRPMYQQTAEYGHFGNNFPWDS